MLYLLRNRHISSFVKIGFYLVFFHLTASYFKIEESKSWSLNVRLVFPPSITPFWAQLSYVSILSFTDGYAFRKEVFVHTGKEKNEDIRKNGQVKILFDYKKIFILPLDTKKERRKRMCDFKKQLWLHSFQNERHFHFEKI